MTLDVNVPAPPLLLPATGRGGVRPGRTRHPADAMRLIIACGALLVASIVSLAVPARVLGTRTGTFETADPSSTVGHALVAAVQVLFIATVVALAFALLR